MQKLKLHLLLVNKTVVTYNIEDGIKDHKNKSTFEKKVSDWFCS